MNILETRHSIRKYNPDIKIDSKEMLAIIQLATKAPSSMNMQPWRFFIVESLEAKKNLSTVLYGNQSQLETSSAMVCLFVDLKKHLLADTILTQAYEAGLIDQAAKDRRLNYMLEQSNKQDTLWVAKWGLVDGGLVAMQFMLAAKTFGYDTCPIGGFNREKLAEALNLDQNRYEPVMIISIGKASEDASKTVRLSPETVTKFL
jgi:nitroreductase